MSNQVIVIKSDGTHTTPMNQAQTEIYLGKLLNPDRQANLKQSLNDVYGNKGKATGSYRFGGFPVLHASSGVVGVKSVSLFFYDNGGNHYIIAMGEHTGASTYKLIDYGQANGEFKFKATISI